MTWGQLSKYLNSPPIHITLLIALSASLRFWDLMGHSLWIDEALTFYQSQQLNSVLAKGYHPIGHYAFLNFWMSLFGTSTTSARICFATIGTLSTGLIYYIGFQITKNRLVAIFSGLIFALLPLEIWHAKEVRMYSLWTFCYLVSLIGLFGFSDRKLSKFSLSMYVVGSLGGVLTHYYMAFFILPSFFAAYLLMPQGNRVLMMKKWLALHLPLLLVAVGIFLTLVSFGLIGSSLIPYDLSWNVLANRLNQMGRTALGIPTGGYTSALLYLMIAVAFFCWRADPKIGKNKAWAILLLTLGPFLVIHLLPIRQDIKYSLPTASMLALVSASLLGYLYLWLGKTRTAKAFTATALCTVILFLSPGIAKAVFLHETQEWNSVCNFLNKVSDEDDLIVLAWANNNPFNICYRGKSSLYESPYRISRDRPPPTLKNRQITWLISANFLPLKTYAQLESWYGCTFKIEFQGIVIHKFHVCDAARVGEKIS